MKREEAVEWLRQVSGTVYHNPSEPEGPNAWVAVVRAPAVRGRRGKLILAFGKSLEQAASHAESQYQELWSDSAVLH
ncbi:MAG: hypothetical protein MJE66_11805 [Proteobacteria bacterium]|nr:hypothetical protein [Pseudomonadota bacterium]